MQEPKVQMLENWLSYAFPQVICHNISTIRPTEKLLTFNYSLYNSHSNDVRIESR